MKTLNEYLNEDFFKNVGSTPEDNKKRKIEAWMKEYNIKNYTINKDFTIDVDRVSLINFEEDRLPEYIRFKTVSNEFGVFISRTLQSLDGFPKVAGRFILSECSALKDLSCNMTFCRELTVSKCHNIKSFKGLEKIKKLTKLCCESCDNIESFEGLMNKSVSSIIIQYCPKITSIKDFDPKFNGVLKINDCGIKNLVGLPKEINYLDISDNDNLISLEGCPDTLEVLNAQYCYNLESLDGLKTITKSADFLKCKKLKSLGSTVEYIQDLYIHDTELSKKTDSEIDPNNNIRNIHR